MARSKFDREFEQILEKHWKPLLMLGGAGFVWFSKDKIFIEVMRIVPIAADVMNRIGRLILLGIMIYALIRIFFHYLYLYFEKKRYRYVMMIPHIEDEVTTEKLGQMIRHVHGTGRKPLERLIKGRDWYRMIMYRPEGRKERVRYYIGGPEDGLKRILQAIQSAYIHSEVLYHSKRRNAIPDKRSGGRKDGTKTKTSRGDSILSAVHTRCSTNVRKCYRRKNMGGYRVFSR